MSTADRWGNMVAFVNSNWGGFGSGITVPGYGFLLHNRAQQFTLDPNSPNLIEPHKRPYNTLASGFVMKDGKPMMTIGLMGGDMQAQGMRSLVNIIDLGANLRLQRMARFHHDQVANVVDLESQLFNIVGGPLKAMGHNAVTSNGGSVGGFQAIMFTADPNGTGGSREVPATHAAPPAAAHNPNCPLQPIKGFDRLARTTGRTVQRSGIESSSDDRRSVVVQIPALAKRAGFFRDLTGNLMVNNETGPNRL